ncbi:hypothetical protein AAF712_002168 [Marasmius tenuissimus]|uniref:holo-[acyl-carrier-protein] synthase n=1 Tax=Marasmius tenuissimus TaxID=585030 RepID=A0ABR3AEG4_9AGAR
MEAWAIVYDPSDFPEDVASSIKRASNWLIKKARRRIKKFYRREDACRGLISRLLPRMLLKEKGIAPKDMSFSATSAGKPYITSLGLDTPLAYNVSHDNNLVVMAFSPGGLNPPSFSIGVDVMKVQMSSRRDTYTSFINIFEDQLTPLEILSLHSPSISQEEGLKRFFWIWTLKEAYTKALGLGLGFDFSRVEFDVGSGVVKVDGTVPPGWRFTKFEMRELNGLNVGVVAEHIGEAETVVVSESEPKDWLKVTSAVAFVERAIHTLS